MSGPVVAVLGLGEAGALIAADLHAAGAVVRAFDPLVPAGAAESAGTAGPAGRAGAAGPAGRAGAAGPAGRAGAAESAGAARTAVPGVPGVIACVDDADACRGAAVVLSLTCAHEAEAALTAALPGVGATAVYADLNTSSPGLKARLADLAGSAGVAFCDVALMSPVPGNGLRAPMLACGPAAERFAGLLRPLGASVEVLPGPPGSAAARKLVRSVFYKGLAAAVIESLRAARAADCEDWLRQNIRHELASASAATLDRLEHGSVRHARRRADEMTAAAQFLDELAVPSRMASASAQWLQQLLAEQSSGQSPR